MSEFKPVLTLADLVETLGPDEIIVGYVSETDGTNTGKTQPWLNLPVLRSTSTRTIIPCNPAPTVLA